MTRRFSKFRARRAAAATAGKSAEEQFELGLRSYRRKIRPYLLLITGPFFVAGLVVALLLDGQWDFVGGMAFGCGLAFTVWALEPPAFIEHWRSGYEGERRTARALVALPPAWRVIHDVPADQGNRDHIALGPGGLFLIDSKNLNGKADVVGDQLLVSRFDLPVFDYRVPQGRWARGAAVRLYNELRREFGDAIRVQPVVALWCSFPERAAESNRVGYVHGDELARWLERRPTTLSDDAVAVWSARLERFVASLRRQEEVPADMTRDAT